jgi:AcrR family transcriptional regulator
MSPDRPLRADARRNRALILDAARTALADSGLAVPIDDIARAAGVGAGTVYRHFPTKEMLFEAILLDRVESLTATAADVTHTDFFDFVLAFGDAGRGNRALGEALSGVGVDVHQRLAAARAHLNDALALLLHEAQRTGRVRPDVTAAELFSLLGAVHQASERLGDDPRSIRRLLTIVCDGLRAR